MKAILWRLALATTAIFHSLGSYGQECALEDIAGLYESAFGQIGCEARGDALQCCYGNLQACDKRLMLSRSSPSELQGVWQHANGNRGAAMFAVDESCNMGNGFWGQGTQANSAWRLGRRLESQQPVIPVAKAAPKTGAGNAEADSSSASGVSDPRNWTPRTTPITPVLTRDGKLDVATAKIAANKISNLCSSNQPDKNSAFQCQTACGMLGNKVGALHIHVNRSNPPQRVIHNAAREFMQHAYSCLQIWRNQPPEDFDTFATLIASLNHGKLPVAGNPDAVNVEDHTRYASILKQFPDRIRDFPFICAKSVSQQGCEVMCDLSEVTEEFAEQAADLPLEMLSEIRTGEERTLLSNVNGTARTIASNAGGCARYFSRNVPPELTALVSIANRYARETGAVIERERRDREAAQRKERQAKQLSAMRARQEAFEDQQQSTREAMDRSVGTGVVNSSRMHTTQDSLSIGEVVGRNLSNALEGAVKMSDLKSDFNGKIAEAREAFAKTYPDKPGHAAAEERLAAALMAKDYHYLSSYLATGTTGDAAERVAGFSRLTGGNLDGGIRMSAWQAFGNWVAAVRDPLGGRPEELIFVTNVDEIRSAVDSASSYYATYKAVRDKAEFRAMGLSQE